MAVRFNLDENMPNAAQALLAARGFDCHTVHEEGLVGGFDGDLDFADMPCWTSSSDSC